jgi:hypothetical protein
VDDGGVVVMVVVDDGVGSVSQGIGYPGSMLKQLASSQKELIATEMLTSRVLSLKGSSAPTMYWSGWYYHQQVELPLEAVHKQAWRCSSDFERRLHDG